jgi:hypothetical protein
MKGHEAAGSRVGQWLRAIEEPTGEGLLAPWKGTCGRAFY